jgi:hypothetical protein
MSRPVAAASVTAAATAAVVDTTNPVLLMTCIIPSQYQV